jgi:hypothetical protein
MRESIKQKGLPLYQQVGIPTAGAGAASQMLEPQEEPEYSKGGSIAKMAALAKMKKMKEEMAPRVEAVKALIARDQNRYLADVVPNSLTNAEIESEIKRMAARAKASDRDANLAKFLEPSKVQDRQFHITKNDFSEFNTNPKKEMGSHFGTADQAKSRFANMGEKEGANTMPVHLQLKKPYQAQTDLGVWHDVESWKDYLQAYELGKEGVLGLTKNQIKELNTPQDIRNMLEKKGYDSISYDNMFENATTNNPDTWQKSYITFKPTQVKSAIGNRGTFDPLEPEVNKAKGGKVRMTTNRDTMFMELSNKKLKRK